jgi:signal transduction histidine kinase
MCGEKILEPTAKTEKKGPAPYPGTNGITCVSDCFDFLRENQPGSFDFLYLKHLEQENEELKHQLQQAQKMEAIGDLCGGVVHDFNNILHPIIGNLERLIADTAQDPRLQMPLKNVLKGANRARALVKQILSFSHRAELEIRPVKIQAILREVIKLSRSILPATVKIIQSIDDGCGPALVDATHIHQIAMNMISKAAHAMRHGVGILDIS